VVLAYVGFFAYLGSAGPWLTTYLADRGFGHGVAGTLMATLTASAITGSLLAARVADARRNRRQLQRFLSLGATAATLCWLWVSEPWMGYGVVILQGLCIGPQIPMLDATTIDGLGKERRRYGRIRVWGSLSWGVATLVIGASRQYEAGAEWIIPVSMSGWLLIYHLSTWTMADTQAPAEHQRPQLDLKAAFRCAPLMLLLFTSALHGVAFSNYEYFSARTFEEFGVSPFGISGILMVGILCESVVFWTAPLLLARWNPLHLAIVALLATGVRWWVMPQIGSVAGFALLQPTHAFSFALWYSAALHLISRFVHEEVRTSGQTLLFISLSGGMAVGVAVGGTLREQLGTTATFQGAAVVELLAAAVLILSAGLFSRRETVGARD